MSYKKADASSKGVECCIKFVNKLCTAGDACTYWHPCLDTERLCAGFQTVEGCRKHATCTFKHIAIGAKAASVLTANVRALSPSNRGKQPCGMFTRTGQCPDEKHCRYYHDPNMRR